MEEHSQDPNKRTGFASRNCLLTVLILIGFTMLSIQGSSQSSGTKSFTVVIDAGHGGKDPGAVGKNKYEKNIALAVAKKVGYYIDNRMSDVKVIYTRKTDVFIDLDVRADIANKANADLFISIHVDGVGTPNAYGTSTYVMGSTKNTSNLELAKKENRVIDLEKGSNEKYMSFDPNNPEFEILLTAYQNAFLEQSLDMASRVQDQFRTRAKRRDRGVHPAPFLVLWQTTMPSVLIETGYISNPKEEAFLSTDYGQDLIASGIYRAFEEYKAEIEARTVSTSMTTANTEENNQVNSSVKEDYQAFVNDNNKDAGEKKAAVVIEKTPPITETSIDRPIDSGLEFRIQVLASKNRIAPNSKAFKGFKDFEEMQEGPYYKYLTSPLKTYAESTQLRREIDKSFPGAFIVAFKGGKKMSLDAAIEEDKKKH